MSLTREAVLAVEDRKLTEVHVPEWGEGASLHVRSLSGAERDELEAAVSDAGKAGQQRKNQLARFAIAFACHPDGGTMFLPTDIDVLTKKSSLVLARIVEAGMELNGMREKDVKELQKNS